MTRFFSEKLKDLVPYTPGEQPKDIPELIKLNTNESPFPPSPLVIEAISKPEISRLRLYSDPQCKPLVKALAESHGVNENQVFIGNGSDEVLAFIFHGLCGNGAIYADITYGFYSVFSDMFSVKSVVVPLLEDFSIDTDDYEGIKGTVLIANPNAPTGLCLPLEDIRKLLLQDRDRLVVVDEAYIDFGGDSALSLLPEFDNLLIVRTFSKSRSLAGARIGYAIGSVELIGDINALKFSFNPYNVNHLSMMAGVASVKDAEYFKSCCEKTIEGRAYITKELKACGFKVLDSKTNFVFAGDNPKISGYDYFQKLRENGILVRHFNSPRTSGYVRMTIGTMEQMRRVVYVTKGVL